MDRRLTSSRRPSGWSACSNRARQRRQDRHIHGVCERLLSDCREAGRRHESLFSGSVLAAKSHLIHGATVSGTFGLAMPSLVRGGLGSSVTQLLSCPSAPAVHCWQLLKRPSSNLPVLFLATHASRFIWLQLSTIFSESLSSCLYPDLVWQVQLQYVLYGCSF